MARNPRLFLPHTPLHIVQRGHDRNAVFVEQPDYAYYLENLRQAKADLNVKVFGYCLMTNHVHLLLAPDDEVDGVSRLMKIVAARQTRYVNKLEKRSGTLWEGRFKASLIDSDAYLLACYRYVDLNPVRGRLVDSPLEYRWSSCSDHVKTTLTGVA
jgi:putative transposase